MSSVARPLDLVPPTAAWTVQVRTLMPRMRAVGEYTGSLERIPAGEVTIDEGGLRVTLPSPFQDVPEAGAAVRRAQSRVGSYGAGNGQLYQWFMRQLMYSAVFAASAKRLDEIYRQVSAARPTAAQRMEVMRVFAAMIEPLEGDRQLLTRAEQGFLTALPLLQEDQRDLGAGAASLNRAIAAYEQRIADAMLKYSLHPMTRGLAPVVGKGGALRVAQLRAAQTSIVQAVGNCCRAAEETAVLSGHVLTLLGKYQGVASTLKEAEDAAFVEFMGQFQLDVALGTWAEFQKYLTENVFS